MKNHNKTYSAIIIGAVLSLLVVSFINFTYRAGNITGVVVAGDIKKLAVIFDRISKTCGISGFDHQQNMINFLNVGCFKGSEIGSMNLVYPKRWQGPYLKDNLAVQGKEYMIVKTNRGHFITPGNGVRLPNGAQVGKDIILNESANIPAMMNNQNKLMFKGRALAARVRVGKV